MIFVKMMNKKLVNFEINFFDNPFKGTYFVPFIKKILK